MDEGEKKRRQILLKAITPGSVPRAVLQPLLTTYVPWHNHSSSGCHVQNTIRPLALTGWDFRTLEAAATRPFKLQQRPHEALRLSTPPRLCRRRGRLCLHRVGSVALRIVRSPRLDRRDGSQYARFASRGGSDSLIRSFRLPPYPFVVCQPTVRPVSVRDILTTSINKLEIVSQRCNMY